MKAFMDGQSAETGDMVIKVIRLLLEDLTGSARFRAVWSASTSRSSVN